MYEKLLPIITFSLIAGVTWDYGGMGVWGWRVAFITGAIFFLLSLINKERRSFLLQVPSPFYLLFLIGLFSFIISPIISISLFPLYKFTSYFIFFLLFAEVFKKGKNCRAFGFYLISLGFLFGIYGFLQHGGFVGHSYWANPTLTASRFVNHNHFSAFLEFIIPVNLSLFLSRKNIPLKLLIFFMLLVNLLSLLMAGSRAGMLFLGIGFFLFFFIILRYKLINAKEFVYFSFLVLVLFSLLLIWEGGAIKERIAGLETSRFFSVHQRMLIWKDALKAVAKRPLGYGWGTFPYIFPQFRSFSDRFTPFYIHNEYLQIAWEMGWFGLGLSLWLLWKLLLRIKVSIVSPGNEALKVLYSGFLVGIVVLLLHSLVDFPLRLPAIALIFSISLSMGMWQGRSINTFNRVVLVLLSILMLSGIPLTIASVVGESFFQAGKKQEKIYPGEAEALYKRAYKYYPYEGKYAREIGKIHLKLGRLLPRKRREHLEEAKKWLEIAVRRNKYDASSYVYLGYSYAGLEENRKAGQAFKKAVFLRPQEGNFHFIYASWLIDKDTGKALSEFKKSLSLFHDGFSAKDVLGKCYPRVRVYDKLRGLIPPDSESIWEFAVFLGKNGEERMLRKLEEELKSEGRIKLLQRIEKLKGS